MKKAIFVAFLALVSMVLFTGFASATGNGGVTCMGACEPTPHHPHHPPVQWNRPDIQYGLHTNFEGHLNGGSTTFGSGNGVNKSSTYSLGEQSFKTTADVNMTEFLAGSACNGTCADNKATLGFQGTQTMNTGGMQNSSGTNGSSAYTISDAAGGFKANGSLSFD